MEKSLQHDIVQDLRKRILSMQRVGKPAIEPRNIGLGPIELAFPDRAFPVGAVHEFVSSEAESAAATNGFLTCLLNSMMNRNGFCLWVSSRRVIYPPALKLLGIDPELVIFIDTRNDTEALWVVEEALRCSALIAVVGEVKELSFAKSRRLQLALEQSQVTGFIHKFQPRTEGTTACVARWKITPLPGIIESGMPGVGFPKWNIELAKVRNGSPGSWVLGWSPNGFQHFSEAVIHTDDQPETAQYA